MTKPAKPVAIEGEPLISPEMARKWLLDQGRVKEIDGKLVAYDDQSHFAIAGIAIACGVEDSSFSLAYREATNGHPILSDSVLLDIGHFITEKYGSAED